LGVAYDHGNDTKVFVLVAALAALAGARPVRFPRFKTELTATHPFVLLAVATLGPLEAMIVGVVGLTGVIFRPGRRLSPQRTAFNLGSVVLAAAVAAWSYFATGGAVGGSLWTSFAPLAAATAAYFLVNTGLVTLAITFQQRTPFLVVWRESFEWTAVSYFTGLTLAVCMLAALQAWGRGCWRSGSRRARCSSPSIARTARRSRSTSGASRRSRR
jgi:hypothetical protein